MSKEQNEDCQGYEGRRNTIRDEAKRMAIAMTIVPIATSMHISKMKVISVIIAPIAIEVAIIH